MGFRLRVESDTAKGSKTETYDLGTEREVKDRLKLLKGCEPHGSSTTYKVTRKKG